jgi:steroid delta-isomerase-like uncharacterized protein
MQHLSEVALRSAWAAAWDRGDVDALDSIAAPGYVRRSSGSASNMSLSQLKAEIAAIREGFPDLRTTIDSVVMGDRAAAVFWTSEGTHQRPFLGVPATGRRVRTRGSNHLTVSGGRIQVETVTWDGSEMLACIGVRSLHDEPARLTDDQAGGPDPEVLKQFNRQFVTGVTVVTTRDGDGQPRGLAVNAYASISLEPPLALVCVQKTSSSYPYLFAGAHLGINVLSAAQLPVVTVFGRSGPDKFAHVPWHAAPHGSPLIDESAASLEAEIRERFQARTHTIFVCRVRHAEVCGEHPMIYRGGRFFTSAALRPLDTGESAPPVTTGPASIRKAQS